MEAPRPKWIWATSYLKVALNPVGVGSAAALIAVWLMELNWPSAHDWFGKYPVTIGLITGLLNLIFTLSLVNRLIQRRDEIRWRDIRNTTLKGLNDEVRSTRAPMMALAHGDYGVLVPWRSDKPRKLMLSTSQEAELNRWLESPRAFTKASRDRKYAVSKDVEWPW
jgi:hypothetical protein